MTESAIVKDFFECFEKKVKWNNADFIVLFVPKYNEPDRFVSPGYWNPERTVTASTRPSCNTHSVTYSREELMLAGAKPTKEYLWARRKGK